MCLKIYILFLIFHNSRCVKAFGYDGEEQMTQKLLSMTEKVARNDIFLFGQEHRNVWKLDRTLIWTKEIEPVSILNKNYKMWIIYNVCINIFHQQDKYKHYIQCPIAGDKAIPKFKLLALCGTSKCLQKRTEKPCPNALDGQVITIKVFPTLPYYIPPIMFNKPLSGFTIRLAKDLGDQLNFIPKFDFSGGGKYYPQNNSFGPGVYRAV